MNKSVNQFTYVEGDQCVARCSASRASSNARCALRYVFMNLDTYEETRMKKVRASKAAPLQRSLG